LLGVSLAPAKELRLNPYLFFPKTISLTTYRHVLSSGVIPRSLVNSLFLTVGGVSISMVMTSFFAYGLSKKGVPGVKLLNFFLLIFIVFQVGIIPLYITMRDYGLIGSFWSVILVSAINPFWCIIMRNFFEQLPMELLESAKIEGASELRIFFQIVIPISAASFAAISLFYAVFFWNDYFLPLMFISKSDKWPVTVWLFQIVSAFQQNDFIPSDAGAVVEDNIKATVIFIAMVPIVIIYPFLQKYFAQGVTLGAVKG
jgi:putative aldouronate transport system permease protein